MYPVYDIRTDIRPTVAEIDLGALRHNADVISACVGPRVGLLAVVKADAYGHGAVVCARSLERRVWGFAVSLVEEGVELRRGGIQAPIVVLGSAYGWSHRDVLAYRLTPVVGDPDDLERFRRAAEDVGVAGPVGYHLKIDTGMGRLGIRPEALGPVLEQIRAAPGLQLTGLCTHLGDADGPDEAPTRGQLGRFAEARAALEAAGLRPALTHVANSAATVRFPEARGDLVRPGIALYGVNPSPHAAFANLQPVLSLKSRVVALREVEAGGAVSYAGLYRAARASRIATVPVGYADGYTRRLTGRAHVLVRGARCPVVGAVTMDMSMVDVTDVPDVRLGDEVVLLGTQARPGATSAARITAEELAEAAGTIPWEIFCGVSKRVPRVYVGERS